MSTYKTQRVWRRTSTRAPLPRGERHRLFVPPLGWPLAPRLEVVTPADRHPLLVLNRYPRQVIGFAVRLPDEHELGGRVRHHALSVLWSKPARWWAR